MHILVTGAAGWLAQALIPRLRRDDRRVVGLDARPGPHVHVVGSVADRELVRRTVSERGITAVVHAAALHKPDIARRPAGEFVAVNVQGTLNLLEAAVAAGVTGSCSPRPPP